MDFLRSCYSVEASFTIDGTSLVDVIDWRFVDSHDHVLFPGRHVFGSLNWSRNRFGFPAATLGEIPGSSRVYSKGADPTPLLGSHHCGDDEWYINGVPLPLSYVPLDIHGEIACCSGLQGQPHDAEPPPPPSGPGHIEESWTGRTAPATFLTSLHWGYFLPFGDRYTWLNFFTALVGRRRCQFRQVRATPFGGLFFRDLICRSYDEASGVSTWEDPTGDAVPHGEFVTIYPGPYVPRALALETGGRLLTEGLDVLTTE